MAPDIPQSIGSFVEKHIDSVELLHVLALLHDHPEREWTLDAIASELRSSESSVEKRAKALIDRRVLAPGARQGSVLRYRPYDEPKGAVISEFLVFFKHSPYRLIELIFSNRTLGVQSIADAFRFRKED